MCINLYICIKHSSLNESIIIQSQNNAPVQRLIDRYQEETMLVFKPSRRFYEHTGINRVRFAQLASGEKRPMLDEADNLTKYFSRFFPSTINDLI